MKSKNLKTLFASALVIGAAALCTFGLTGCEREDKSNDNHQTDGGTYTGGDDDGPDVGDDGTVIDWENNRKDAVELSKTFNAEAGTIAPYDKKEVTISYGAPSSDGYYSYKVNAHFYKAENFEKGGKYHFEGDLDSETGRVKDMVVIDGTVSSVYFIIDNAILKGDKFYGDSQLDFVVPSRAEFVYGGEVYQTNPLYPLDSEGGVPLVMYEDKTDKTDIRAPRFSRKQVAGGKPSFVW